MDHGGEEQPCSQCGSLCCRYMGVAIDPPDDEQEVDHIRWCLLHRNVSVAVDEEGDWFVLFHTPCTALGEDGRCLCYAERPSLCREHGVPPGRCEFHGDMFAARFDNVAAFDSWLLERPAGPASA